MKIHFMEQNEHKVLSEFDPPPLFKDMTNKREYCVYILQNKKDKSIYIGYTNDLKRRTAEHNKGLCPSTKGKEPFRIAAYKAYSSEIDARTREKRLKQFKNAYKELLKRISNCLEKYKVVGGLIRAATHVR